MAVDVVNTALSAVTSVGATFGKFLGGAWDKITEWFSGSRLKSSLATAITGAWDRIACFFGGLWSRSPLKCILLAGASIGGALLLVPRIAAHTAISGAGALLGSVKRLLLRIVRLPFAVVQRLVYAVRPSRSEGRAMSYADYRSANSAWTTRRDARYAPATLRDRVVLW